MNEQFSPDARREDIIQALADAMAGCSSYPKIRGALWECMRQQINARSPEQVQRMERRAGLGG